MTVKAAAKRRPKQVSGADRLLDALMGAYRHGSVMVLITDEDDLRAVKQQLVTRARFRSRAVVSASKATRRKR